jgi:hypothetical protein
MTSREKNRAYRTRRALRIIRRAQPKTVEDARDLPIGGLTFVDEGAFRKAYRIRGTNLLIKFPLNRLDDVCKIHTRMEVKKIRALREFPVIRKHIPPVYYFHSRDGVMVTRYYPKSKGLMGATHQLISDMIKGFCGVILGDLCSDNLRTKPYGNLIFIDLGY